jgi:dimethylsulfoniopropionate demethylase
VACERQVEVRGPDAARLMQLLTPRNLSRMAQDQCLYAPMVDDAGCMLNDPVVLQPGPGRYWISIADSDMLLWVKGVATGMQLDVDVIEPDVSPLAVQGPKADMLLERVFGSAVRDIRFFRFNRLPFHDTTFIVARSGYSRQSGYEIYVEGAQHAEPLWDALFDAGSDLKVRAGAPNLIERIEGGLLSFGNDMTFENNPYECGLGRFCDLDDGFTCFGRDALLRVRDDGPVKQIRGIALTGDPVSPCIEAWPVHAGEQHVGRVSSAAFSPDLGTNVCIAMIDRGYWSAGTEVTVDVAGEQHLGIVCTLPFVSAGKP